MRSSKKLFSNTTKLLEKEWKELLKTAKETKKHAKKINKLMNPSDSSSSSSDDELHHSKVNHLQGKALAEKIDKHYKKKGYSDLWVELVKAGMQENEEDYRAPPRDRDHVIRDGIKHAKRYAIQAVEATTGKYAHITSEHYLDLARVQSELGLSEEEMREMKIERLLDVYEHKLRPRERGVLQQHGVSEESIQEINRHLVGMPSKMSKKLNSITGYYLDEQHIYNSRDEMIDAILKNMQRFGTLKLIYGNEDPLVYKYETEQQPVIKEDKGHKGKKLANTKDESKHATHKHAEQSGLTLFAKPHRELTSLDINLDINLDIPEDWQHTI